MRYLIAISILVLAMMGVSFAQSSPSESAVPAPWQASVTGQIEAFRHGDSAAALEFAAVAFRGIYDDPDRFYQDVMRSGYGPIVNSRSHSFGKFAKVSETLVLQVVRLVGPDQGLYEAMYQVGNEGGEWRIVGVALKREAGVGI